MAKGRKTGGRSKGTPNKVTADNKAKLEQAFERLGDVDGLVTFGQENPAAFYALWGRLLPKAVEVTGEAGGPLTIRVVRE